MSDDVTKKQYVFDPLYKFSLKKERSFFKKCSSTIGIVRVSSAHFHNATATTVQFANVLTMSYFTEYT